MDIYAVNLKNKNYSFELFNELIESKTVQNIIDRNRYNDYKILGRYQNNSNSGLLFNTELTNKLKEQKQFEWIQKMSNIQQQARELVCNELIYV